MRPTLQSPKDIIEQNICLYIDHIEKRLKTRFGEDVEVSYLEDSRIDIRVEDRFFKVNINCEEVEVE